MLVNYEDVIASMGETIIPHHFNSPLTEAEVGKILDVGKTYSKARVEGRKWEEDSEAKEATATAEVVRAAAVYMKEGFDELQRVRLKGNAL